MSDPGRNRIRKIDDRPGDQNDTEVVYYYDLDDVETYGSDNNRLMYSETFKTTGGAHDLLSTTYYYYNEGGNVTRVVEHPAGTEDYLATRMVYALNGSAATYVMGETWQWPGYGGCPTEGTYDITYAREFRYDGARQRYLNRELDTDQLQQYGLLVSVSETWSDYDGDSIYGDFTVDSGTVTNERWFDPGIARSGAPGDPSTTEYYHADHLGTTRLLSDNDSAGILPAAFTAFGERVAGIIADPLDRYGYAGAWGYQGHQEFPYLHVGHRYYDPPSGRFLQRDLIGLWGGLNVYGYVQNVPTIWVDPKGLVNAGGGGSGYYSPSYVPGLHGPGYPGGFFPWRPPTLEEQLETERQVQATCYAGLLVIGGWEAYAAKSAIGGALAIGGGLAWVWEYVF